MENNQKSGSKDLLGKNIKHLRNIHGETLQDLGNAVNLGNTTIKNYENSDRMPDPQTLKALAKHYGKTVDELINSDLSDLGSIAFSVKSSSDLVNMMKGILPLSCSDEALGNPDFRKGYEGCCRILESFSRNEGIRGSTIPECFEAFGKSVEDSELSEGIANMVWLIFLLWTQLVDDNMAKALSALMYPRKSNPPFIKTFLAAKDNESTAISKQKQEFVEDLDDTLFDLLRELKSRPDWSYLADYYLALRYVLSMVDTGLSPEMNIASGMQMMLSSLRLGNPYAFNFVEISLKSKDE